MSSIDSACFQARSDRRRTGLLLSCAAVALLVFSTGALRAQFGAGSPPTQVHDSSVLKPPAGARVAMVEFADLECPDCANANPLLKEAVAKYKIPWVRYDFPLPFHNWSTTAAINARWFDSKSKSLGNDYRDYVFENQRSIFNPDILASYTQKFAQSHGIALPFAIDPQGKFAALVKADYALGQRVGIEHTPTIWVVTANGKGAPFVEVVDRSRLFQLIDQALADTSSPVKAAAKPANKKPAAK